MKVERSPRCVKSTVRLWRAAAHTLNVQTEPVRTASHPESRQVNEEIGNAEEVRYEKLHAFKLSKHTSVGLFL